MIYLKITKMDKKSKVLAKAIISTFAQEIGGSLQFLNLFNDKIEKGEDLNKKELKAIFLTWTKVHSTLNYMRKLANDDFKEAYVKSDRLGLCYYIEKKP